MVWLSSQVWVWLLLAFVVGVVSTTLVFLFGGRLRSALARMRRAEREPGAYPSSPRPSPRAGGVPATPAPDPAETTAPTDAVGPAPGAPTADERTEQIRVVPASEIPYDPRDTPRGGREHRRTHPRDDTEAPVEGRAQGILPLGSADWHARNEWPDEQDMTRDEQQRRHGQ